MHKLRRSARVHVNISLKISSYGVNFSFQTHENTSSLYCTVRNVNFVLLYDFPSSFSFLVRQYMATAIITSTYKGVISPNT